MSARLAAQVGLLAYRARWHFDRFCRPICQKLSKRPRLLAPSPRDAQGGAGRKPQVINLFLGIFDAPRSYLEIGVSYGHTLEAVVAEKRVAVDPFPMFAVESSLMPAGVTVHSTTSQQFFSRVEGHSYDVIYLDGSHEAVQTYVDTIYSLTLLRPAGVVVIDGARPWDRPSSLPELESSIKEKNAKGINHNAWFGDVYKGVSFLMKYHPELDVRIIGNSVGERYCQAVVKLSAKARPKAISGYVGLIHDIRWEDVFDREIEPLWDQKFELRLDRQEIKGWLCRR